MGEAVLSGAQLRAVYPAEHWDPREVLAMLGPDAAHLLPENVVAFRYPSMAAALAYAAANRAHHGYVSWQVATTAGVFGVVDFTSGKVPGHNEEQAVTEQTRPETPAQAVCEHYWATHCYRGMHLKLCMLCHGPDWADLEVQFSQARAAGSALGEEPPGDG